MTIYKINEYHPSPIRNPLPTPCHLFLTPTPNSTPNCQKQTKRERANAQKNKKHKLSRQQQ